MQTAQREHKIGTIKFIEQEMANLVAYPDLALEKFIVIDSSKDPTALIPLLEKEISFSLGSRTATNEKKTLKSSMTIDGKPFLDLSHAV